MVRIHGNLLEDVLQRGEVGCRIGFGEVSERMMSCNWGGRLFAGYSMSGRHPESHRVCWFLMSTKGVASILFLFSSKNHKVLRVLL